MADKSYIISYPISASKDFNMALSHHCSRLVDDVEEVDVKELRETYKDFDPRIKKIVDMMPAVKAVAAACDGAFGHLVIAGK